MATGRAAKVSQAENDLLKRGIVEEIGKTVRWAIVGISAFGVAYLLGHAIEALAGKQTDANILVKMLGVFEVSMALSWMAGGAGVIYGRSQAKQKKTTVERLHKRIAELESVMDPGRTSSKLTPRGETNKEDR
jgi:hypothetical protein